MQLFNNFECDVTPIVEGSSYTFTLKAGRTDIPNDTNDIALSLLDDAGNAARVLMNKVGTTYTISRIFTTTEADNAIPVFGAGFKAVSSDLAEILMIARMNYGVIYTGQSNAVGWNQGKTSLSRKWFIEEDNRIKARFNADVDVGDYTGYAIEPCPHGSLSLSGANNLGPFIPLAHLLLNDGYNQVTGILQAVNAASISIYDDQAAQFLLLCDKIEDFLNDSPLNHLGLWVHQQGETDQASGGGQYTPAQWVTANVDMKENVRQEIITRTGVDILKLPYIAVGMHGDYRNSGGYDNVNDMEQGIADIPANMDYSAYVPLGTGLSITNNGGNGESGTDDTHIAAHAYHTVVAPAIYNAIKTATLNVPATAPDITPPVLSVATGTQTGSTTATGNVTTDEGNGTLYYYVTQNASETANDIIANGDTQSVNTVGVQAVSLTGLTASTSYYIHYVQVDNATNQSNVIASNQFTTAAADVTPPTLTLPTGTETSDTTASGTVTTDETGGTLFYLISQNASETLGTITGSGLSQVVSASGIQNVSLTGLTASTTYYLHYVHRDASSNDSNVASSASFTTSAAPDVTAPVLSLPTGTQTGQTTADGTVSTDEGNGTLYFIATENASETAGTIKAGSSQAVSATGVQNVSFTGLTAGTTYYAHYVQDDASSNESNVVSSTSFTTQSAGVSHPLTDALAPTHYFRSDAGLNTGTGNDFASWENRGTDTGADIVSVNNGNPQVDANGVNFTGGNGGGGLDLVLNGLFENSTGSSVVIKYKGTSTGYLYNGFSCFVALGGEVSAEDTCLHQGFLGPNQLTSSSDLGDDVEHVIALTIADGGQYDVTLDGSSVGSIAAGAINVSTTAVTLGCQSNGNNSMNGYIKAFCAKPGVKWTPAEIANITSEMP